MGKFAFLEEEEEEDTRAVASRLINSAPHQYAKVDRTREEKTKTAVRSVLLISLMHTQRSNHFQFFPGKRKVSLCHALFLRVQTKLEGEVRSK